MTMIEEVKKGDDLYAIVVKAEFHPEQKYNFFSPQDGYLQFGINTYKAEDKIADHIHLPCERSVTRVEEIISLRKGRLNVRIFDENENQLALVEMKTGDILYQIQGGHGFDILEDSEIFEIKQGPYTSKVEDKRLF